MAWGRLHENWMQLKGMIESCWRPEGKAPDPESAEARRIAWVERIQKLAREEIREQLGTRRGRN